MRRRSRSSPPSRRKAAKNWAGSSTSGSKRPASRSCPAEKPRFPLATISSSPLPWASFAAHRTGDLRPHAYHAPELQKNTPQDEKAWAGKLGLLIRTRRGKQGLSSKELDHGGRGPRRGAVRIRDAVDGADHQLAVRPGKAAGRPLIPLPGEGRAAEEDAGPAEVIPL